MINFLKTLFGGKETGATRDTVALVEPHLTIARANNEMQLRTQAAVEMWGLDVAER
ncbi:hypothetical protein [Dickeya zeae]|uniref:hypothetical protein n=1 Tax=Dickeya zeae TaxID=204042 RepID=UPI0014438960|nr:hypothetical protein [Dickeya zeae]